MLQQTAAAILVPRDIRLSARPPLLSMSFGGGGRGRAMVFWGVLVQSERPLVGCFCTVALVHELREAFGPDFECDGADLLAGHGERTARTAAGLGIRPAGPVVLCAARNEVQFGPRHAFRLRVGPEAFVSGTLDRYSVRVECEREADFPEPARGRFLAFLSSLQLGGVRDWATVSPDAEPDGV